MSEGAGSARGAQKKKHALVRVFFFCLLRVRCVAFLRKTEVFLKNIGCNVFYRRPRVFLYKTYEYLYFSRKSRFFQKLPQRMQNKKNMTGHVLRELHRFLERNKKRRTKNGKNKQKKKKNTHTHTENKKHAEPKNTLTHVHISGVPKDELECAMCRMAPMGDSRSWKRYTIGVIPRRVAA